MTTNDDYDDGISCRRRRRHLFLLLLFHLFVLLFSSSSSSLSSSSSPPSTPLPLSSSAPPYSCASRYGLGSVTSRKDGRRKRQLAESRERERGGKGKRENREKRRTTGSLGPTPPLRQVGTNDAAIEPQCGGGVALTSFVPFTQVALLRRARLLLRGRREGEEDERGAISESL